MADFKRALKLLNKLEFNSPKNFLHKNKTEKDYTIAGIYRYAHPSWIGWDAVDHAIQNHNGNIQESSQVLYYNESFRTQSNNFIKKEFWDKMKLDEVNDQTICNEIFLFGYNAGRRTAIRKAQKIVNVKADGLIGKITINALNSYNANDFSMEFDELELQYYASLIAKKPSFEIYKKGWNNRAVFV